MERARHAGLTAGAGALLALSVLSAVPVRAQDSATFGTLGPVGIGSTDGQTGYAIHAALGHRFGRSVLSGRAAGVLVDNDSFLWDEVWDLAVVYGRVFGGEETSYSIGAGPAYVGGSVFDDKRTFGLALEAQAFIRTSASFSVGLYAFGNVNQRSSFAGVTLALRFGHL
jgi:hypothetical protein